MEKQKRVVLINDISCVGRSSLTAAVPIVSACGLESIPLPTGIFSAHTEFEGFEYTDLTGQMEKTAAHWKKLGLRFDGICIGYLSEPGQAKLLNDFLIDFKKSDTVCIVDPVMGDNGSFYERITDEYVSDIRCLCSMADVIVPNVTEAELLCERELTKGPHGNDLIGDLLLKLSGICHNKVIITGVEDENNQIGCAYYDSETKEAGMLFTPKVPGRFPGTGDVFTAAFTAAMLKGKPFKEALQIAMSFTLDSVEKTSESGSERRYGLRFETQLDKLIKTVK